MDHPIVQGSDNVAPGLSDHRSRKRWVRLAVSLSLGIALMVVVYLIFIGLAALHVSHGFWSAFQSLGWVRGGTRKFMEVLSGLVGALIFLMFALPPLAIVAGYIS